MKRIREPADPFTKMEKHQEEIQESNQAQLNFMWTPSIHARSSIPIHIFMNIECFGENNYGVDCKRTRVGIKKQSGNDHLFVPQ